MGNEEIKGMTLYVSYPSGDYKVYIPIEAIKNVTSCLFDDDLVECYRIYKREMGEW